MRGGIQKKKKSGLPKSILKVCRWQTLDKKQYFKPEGFKVLFFVV
jgi:hypothetical protein